MSAAGAAGGADGPIAAQKLDVEISRSVASFTVKKLQVLLRALHIATSGRKGMLQDRFYTFLARLRTSAPQLQRVLELVRAVDAEEDVQPLELGGSGAMSGRPLTYTEEVNNLTNSLSNRQWIGNDALSRAIGGRITSFGEHRPSPKRPGTTTGPVQSVHALSFRKSPFYELVEPLHKPLMFMRPHMRQNLQRTIMFRLDQLNIIDPNSRILVLSQQYMPLAPDHRPVYFPHNNEIYVDDRHVPANTRGVRGRTGSARPVDVTDQLRRSSGAYGDTQHRLTFTMSCSLQDPGRDDSTVSRSFGVVTYLAKLIPIDRILEDLQERPHIPYGTTRDRIVSHFEDAEDAGFETTEAVYGLKDPTVFARIQIPIRSKVCTHVECFDALSYLQLQQTAETWRCPFCDKDITYDSLAVDEYFSQVLSKAGPSSIQFKVSKDGSWKFKDESDDEDDDTDDTESDDETPAPKRLRREPDVIDLTGDDENVSSIVPQTGPEDSVHGTSPRGPSTSPYSGNVHAPDAHPGVGPVAGHFDDAPGDNVDQSEDRSQHDFLHAAQVASPSLNGATNGHDHGVNGMPLLNGTNGSVDRRSFHSLPSILDVFQSQPSLLFPKSSTRVTPPGPLSQPSQGLDVIDLTQDDD